MPGKVLASPKTPFLLSLKTATSGIQLVRIIYYLSIAFHCHIPRDLEAELLSPTQRLLNAPQFHYFAVSDANEVRASQHILLARWRETWVYEIVLEADVAGKTFLVSRHLSLV